MYGVLVPVLVTQERHERRRKLTESNFTGAEGEGGSGGAGGYDSSSSSIVEGDQASEAEVVQGYENGKQGTAPHTLDVTISMQRNPERIQETSESDTQRGEVS